MIEANTLEQQQYPDLKLNEFRGGSISVESYFSLMLPFKYYNKFINIPKYCDEFVYEVFIDNKTFLYYPCFLGQIYNKPIDNYKPIVNNFVNSIMVNILNKYTVLARANPVHIEEVDEDRVIIKTACFIKELPNGNMLYIDKSYDNIQECTLRIL